MRWMLLAVCCALISHSRPAGRARPGTSIMEWMLCSICSAFMVRITCTPWGKHHGVGAVLCLFSAVHSSRIHVLQDGRNMGQAAWGGMGQAAWGGCGEAASAGPDSRPGEQGTAGRPPLAHRHPCRLRPPHASGAAVCRKQHGCCQEVHTCHLHLVLESVFSLRDK